MKEAYVYIIDAEYPHKEERLAGRTPLEWLLSSLGELPFSVVAEVKEPLPEARYIATIPSSCPLVDEAYITSCVREMERRSIASADLGRGKIARREDFFLEEAKIRFHADCLLDLADGGSRERAENALYVKVAERLEKEGVILKDRSLVQIAADCVIEKGAIVEPFVRLEKTVVRSGAVIGSFSVLSNSEIGERAEIIESRVFDSKVGADAKIGPFAYLRMGSAVGKKCRIGDFVEVKASSIGEGAKAAHLAYIGDAEVGAETNVGCGTVFANYDGKEKHRTKVGERAFIGANVNLIAPVTVGEGAYIAAATTVTENVKTGAFVIGRSRAEEKERKKRET